MLKYTMALAEIESGRNPILEAIFTDLKQKVGDIIFPTDSQHPEVLEYIKGEDEEGKKESKVLPKMQRGLAQNEVLLVTFTPDSPRGTTNAFIYSLPEGSGNGVKMEAAMHVEQY